MVKARLLDVNVLIALAWPNHVHHAKVARWFDSVGHKAWATCPMTQAGFVRISSNPAIIPDAVRPEQALVVLQQLVAQPGHGFWSDTVSMGAPNFRFSTLLTGHRQVTDAYLVSLAAQYKGVVATLDRGILALAPNHLVEWIG